MKPNSVNFRSLLAAVVFAMSSLAMVAYAPATMAQSPALDAATRAALNDALSTGNAQAVELIVAANQGDAAATQSIASLVLAAAQSIKAADPGGAGILAAIALSSGGLQGTAAATAMGIVNVSGSTIAATIIAFSNAGVPPAVIANAVLVGVTFNPVTIGTGGGFGGGGSGNVISGGNTGGGSNSGSIQ